MSRTALLTDAQWERIKEFMPSSEGKRGRPFRDHRMMLEGIIFRFRTGIAWRDLPDSFGPWQTVWERHDRYAADGTYDRIHAPLVAEADAASELDWMVSVDSTVPNGAQPGSQGAEKNTCLRAVGPMLNLSTTPSVAPGAG